jgi:hypothetical protein
MRSERFTPIESWAIRSKARAFGFLLCVALSIAVFLTGATAVLVTVASQGVLPLAVASTP